MTLRALLRRVAGFYQCYKHLRTRASAEKFPGGRGNGKKTEK